MALLTQIYRVIAHQAEEGGYWGEVLELPGCVSQGETIDELRANITEAIEAVLDSELEEPRIDIELEPTVHEKQTINLVASEGYNQLVSATEASETWTAAS